MPLPPEQDVTDLLFFALLGVYLWFGSKVDEWITIAQLGFSLETPSGFLSNPRAYDIVRSALLVATFGSIYFATRLPWYGGIICTVAAWFATTALGQRRAFETYRHRCHEAVAETEDEAGRAFFTREAQKSNSELRDLVVKKMKLGL
jgi:hypothetical protein